MSSLPHARVSRCELSAAASGLGLACCHVPCFDTHRLSHSETVNPNKSFLLEVVLWDISVTARSKRDHRRARLKHGDSPNPPVKQK